ncbi:MAG: DUF1800 family protein [Flammeovirgaceae bacterium]
MASLTPNTAVLGEKYAKHLLKRATFAYSKALVDVFAKLTAEQAVELLFQEKPLVLALPYDAVYKTGLDGKNNTGTQLDGYWTERTDVSQSYFGATSSQKASYVSAWWWYNAIHTPTIKFKFSHFLSTRFTIARSNGGNLNVTSFYDHIRLLLFYSVGNYKSLAKKMTLDNYMLQYLNNTNNLKTAANENYAREFLELFTIGKGPQIGPGDYTNYTEADIVQAAKLLTGFRVQSDRKNIDPETKMPRGSNSFSNHDTSAKTFSATFDNRVINGATSAAAMHTELSEFVEMVFSKDATALNICRKLYRYFVRSTISSEVETDIIIPLAQELKANNYELKPTVGKLLASLHFYDLDDGDATDEVIGAMVKSPVQLISEILTYFGCKIPDPTNQAASFYHSFWLNNLDFSFLSLANMQIFNPPNVAGHEAFYQEPGYDKSWISSATLIARYRIGESLLTGKNVLRTGSPSMGVTLDIVTAIKTGGLVSQPSDPVALTTDLCTALFGQLPDVERINYFKKALLGDYDDHYWTYEWTLFTASNNKTVVEPRLKELVRELLSAPEFQLF